MLEILFCTLVAFAISLVLTPEIIKIAHAYNKHDEINERKIHTSNVPRFGGLAVFFGFLIATLLFSTLWQHMINVHLIIALVLIVIIGFRDDFLPLKPKFKLAVEILASLLIIHFGNIRIESMHGLFGIGELPLWTSYGLTVFTLIVVTNAVNLIDGIDGLAGSFSLLVFGGYGCWFYSANDLATSIFCFGMVGAILGFLIFNYRTLIFMGDTGSLVIGFLAAAISLIFLQDNAQLPLDSPLKFPSPVFFICSILGFPLIDTIRVFAIRVASGRSPFSPDKNHLHHSLISLDLPHYQATAILCTTNMAFVGLAYLGQGVGDTVGILMATGLAFGLAHWLKKRSDAYLAAKKAGEPAPHIEVAAHPEPHPQEISL
jgi:UDP-N-acetylmuramyl pentapeptide phosphotransferase/UDP-N-acetylglucosamine-1-phosphate transferase